MTKPLQINFADERFYKVDNNFYPSVTHILDAYPKGQAFTQWLKDVGNQAKYIAERAALSGTKVHEGAEMLLNMEDLEWTGDNYTEGEWRGLIGFKEFMDIVDPEVLAVETVVYSKTYGYAGTVDLVCKINGERWVVDFKFGNAIYPTYWLQLASYAKAWTEMYGDEIDRIAVLHLKAKTRGSRKGSIQGRGWQLKEAPKTINDHFNIFLSTLSIWKEEHPDSKPMDRIYPTKLTLKK